MNFYDKDEIMIFHTINQEIQNKIIDKKLKIISLDKININDNLYVIFHPFSQKYIYTLTPKYGKVKTINNIENVIDIMIDNYKNSEENLLHAGVSYMGHSYDYDYTIYLVE